MNLHEELGKIDIYLLDQVMRGRVSEDAHVLDAGCGRGRNLVWFMRRGIEVFGLDRDPEAVDAVRRLAARHGVPDPTMRFRAESIEQNTFPHDSFDLVICNAVLHFAIDHEHFQAMVRALHAVTKPGGLCFARLASTIGIEDVVEPVEGAPERWARFPDGHEHYMVDLDYLLRTTEDLGAELADPIKTVNVQGRRCMTNWVWRRGA